MTLRKWAGASAPVVFGRDELRLVPFWVLALLPVLRLYQIEFEDEFEYEYEFEGVGKSWG